MRETLEMVTASRIQNIKKNTCFVTILLFRNVRESSFGALGVESPHGGAIGLFPKQVSYCRGSGALKGWLGTVTPERPRGHETNDSRKRFIDIDVF